MFDFLEKVRRMPLSTRRVVAGGAAALITGVFFLMWLTVSPLSPGAETETVAVSAGPWAALRESIAALANGTKESLSGVRTTFSDAKTALEAATALGVSSTTAVTLSPVGKGVATTTVKKTLPAAPPANKKPFGTLPVSKEEPMR